MEEEILISGAAVFKERGKKVSWLLVQPDKDDNWQLPKGVVRREESSVRGVMRTISKLAGLRAAVIEEVGRINTATTKNGSFLSKRVIYYLVQHRGKFEEEGQALIKLCWLEYKNARARLKTASERRMLSQATAVLRTWQKQGRTVH